MDLQEIQNPEWLNVESYYNTYNNNEWNEGFDYLPSEMRTEISEAADEMDVEHKSPSPEVIDETEMLRRAKTETENIYDAPIEKEDDCFSKVEFDYQYKLYIEYFLKQENISALEHEKEVLPAAIEYGRKFRDIEPSFGLYIDYLKKQDAPEHAKEVLPVTVACKEGEHSDEHNDLDYRKKLRSYTKQKKVSEQMHCVENHCEHDRKSEFSKQTENPSLRQRKNKYMGEKVENVKCFNEPVAQNPDLVVHHKVSNRGRRVSPRVAVSSKCEEKDGVISLSSESSDDCRDLAPKRKLRSRMKQEGVSKHGIHNCNKRYKQLRSSEGMKNLGPEKKNNKAKGEMIKNVKRMNLVAGLNVSKTGRRVKAEYEKKDGGISSKQEDCSDDDNDLCTKRKKRSYMKQGVSKQLHGIDSSNKGYQKPRSTERINKLSSRKTNNKAKGKMIENVKRSTKPVTLNPDLVVRHHVSKPGRLVSQHVGTEEHEKRNREICLPLESSDDYSDRGPKRKRMNYAKQKGDSEKVHGIKNHNKHYKQAGLCERIQKDVNIVPKKEKQDDDAEVCLSFGSSDDYSDVGPKRKRRSYTKHIQVSEQLHGIDNRNKHCKKAGLSERMKKDAEIVPKNEKHDDDADHYYDSDIEILNKATFNKEKKYAEIVPKKEKYDHDADYCYDSDVEILDKATFYKMTELSPMIREGYHMTSAFRQQIISLLRKPYDKKELKKLYLLVRQRKAKLRHRDMRNGRTRSYKIDEDGKSYLDWHPDFKKQLRRSTDDRPKSLNLLRGFFFWLQHSTQIGSFIPWKDKECLATYPKSC